MLSLFTVKLNGFHLCVYDVTPILELPSSWETPVMYMRHNTGEDLHQ